MGLPGEYGLVDPQLRLRDHPGVRRDVVPLGEDEDVPRDKFLRGDLRLAAVPSDVGAQRKDPPERLGRLLRLVLLPEAERAVDEVDDQHGDADLGHPGEERDAAADPQQDRHEVGELGEEFPVEGAPPWLPENVRPGPAKPVRGLLPRQPFRTGGEEGAGFPGGYGMDGGSAVRGKRHR